MLHIILCTMQKEGSSQPLKGMTLNYKQAF